MSNKIIFYFESTKHENCICTCFPVEGATVGSDANSYQYTVMKKSNFERWKNAYITGYDFADITGFSPTPEADILEVGLYRILTIIKSRNN